MNQKLKAQLDRAFELTHDLMVHLDENARDRVELAKQPAWLGANGIAKAARAAYREVP